MRLAVYLFVSRSETRGSKMSVAFPSSIQTSRNSGSLVFAVNAASICLFNCRASTSDSRVWTAAFATTR